MLLPGGDEAPVLGEASWEELIAAKAGARLWCEVPHDAGGASVRIALAVTTAEGEEIDLGTEDVAVTLTAVERPATD